MAIQDSNALHSGVKPGQALADGHFSPSAIRGNKRIILSSKGKKNLAVLEKAFNKYLKVKIEYIKPVTSRHSAPIQDDNGERSIIGFKVGKDGNVTMLTNTDMGGLKSYSLDSIDKIDVLDKYSVAGPYARAFNHTALEGNDE